MKTVNFKISVIALTIGLVMFSCSGGSKKGKIDAEAFVEQQLKESAEQTEITAANWQSVVKKRFGIDLAVPSGWVFSDVRSYFSGETVIIIFNQEGENAAKPREIATKIFNTTQTISSEGNFNIDVNINEAGTSGTTSKGKVYENFGETQVMSGSFFGEDYINAFWYYKKDGVKLASLDSDNGRFIVKFEISKVNL